MENTMNRKRSIIIVVVILSIALYLAGVFSGLYANKIIKKETEEDIKILKEETEQYVKALENYINFLDSNLKSMQLEQTFTETLSDEQMCNYSIISLNELVGQLHYYWERLPYRIEEYEKDNVLSEDYLLLKQQYTHLSIRTWILAKNQYDKCNMDLVHGLYFYSTDCDGCVEQGVELDELGWNVRGTGREMILFPVDFDSEESLILNLKEFYGIEETPAVMINDKVFQGKIFKAEELIESSIGEI